MTTIDRFAPEFRSAHLGASQVPAAVGVSPYERPIDLWQRYRGLKSWDVEGDRSAIDIGHALEDGVAQLASTRLGMTMQHAELQTHPRMPWLISSRDRVLEDGAPLEIKTCGISSPGWAAKERWGADGTDEVPVHVAAQVQTQLLVARACDDHAPPTHAFVGALLGGEGLRVYRVPYDEGIARSIVTQAAAFWARVAGESGPPEPDGSDAFTEYLNSKLVRHPRQQRWVESAEADAVGPEVQEAHAALKIAEERYELAKQRALTLIGDGDGIRGSWGSVPLGYRAGKSGLRESLLRAEIARGFFLDGTGDAALQAAIDKAAAFLETCKVAGEPFKAFGPPRPPKVK